MYRTKRISPRSKPQPSGLPARQAAVALLVAVLRERKPLDDALVRGKTAAAMARLEPRDRAFARAIAATVLRRKGELDAVLAKFIERAPPPSSAPLGEILLVAACQLLFLDTPPHAAIDLAVNQAQAEGGARRYDKLANAVLRRVAEQGPALLAHLDAPLVDTPDWLLRRWRAAYGEDARAIALAHLEEPPLDLTVKSDAAGWAARLGGIVLPTGGVRLRAKGPIEQMQGFSEGAWWVQDAAAALPARLLGDVRGKRVADLCAAPGGKTAQLAHSGARVTAVDISPARLKRVQDNLDRLKLEAELVAADAGNWQPDEHFYAVLLDAPCSSTGTIRRHPDILHLKSERDVTEMARLQARLLEHALSLLKPGGALVYCTCSLEPEESERQIADLENRGLLASSLPLVRRERDPGHDPGEPGWEDLDKPAIHPSPAAEQLRVRIDPIAAEEIGGRTDWVAKQGFLRTLPHQLQMGQVGMNGIDGFFAARLVKQAQSFGSAGAS